MKLLLDTHAFIWWRSGDRRLGETARRSIAAASRLALSAASAWEAAFKVSTGKLELPEPFEIGVVRGGVEPLPVSFEHAAGVALLPWHHRDPFDRLLIATARVERLGIVTADSIFRLYGVEVVTA